jgi:hypothetical protein
MKPVSFVIGLAIFAFGLSSVQAAVDHKPTDHHHNHATLSPLPRASPAAIRRCALPHKILNAVSKSACKGYPRSPH